MATRTIIIVEHWTARNGRVYGHVRHRNGNVSDPNSYANTSNLKRRYRKAYNVDGQTVKFVPLKSRPKS